MVSGSKPVFLALALALPAFPQEAPDPVRQAHELIDLLKSDFIEERDKASKALFKMGRKALPPLEEAASGSDLETAARARELVTLIRWGVSPETPASLLHTFTEIVSQGPERKIALIKDLLKNKDPRAGPVLDAIMTSLQEPAVVASLAPWWLRWDTAAIEEKLLGFVPRGLPEIQEALGDHFQFRIDDRRAALEYGKALALRDTPELRKKWKDSMVHSHQNAELAQAISRLPNPSIDLKLARIEALYKSGQRGAADALVREFPPGAELACAYGSPRVVLEIDASLTKPQDRIRALAQTGDFEKALQEWRALGEDVEDRGVVLQRLLEARGDFDLSTSGFLEEALKHSPAEPHRRLAELLAADDPAAALTEFKKAVLLDPRSAQTFSKLAELARKEGDPSRARQGWTSAAKLDPQNPDYPRAITALGPPGGAPPPAGRGCWRFEVPASETGTLFASLPVRLGEFVYFLDPRGFINKAKSAVDPAPVWTYHPPRRFRLCRRGWRYSWSYQNLQVAEFSGLLIAVADLRANTNSLEGSGWTEGAMIAALDPETGKELWTHVVAGIHGGRIFPKEGAVVFAGGGVALFDLAQKKWRWGAGNESLVDGTPWVQGPFVYVGFSNGMLSKFQAQDGALVWTKGKPAPSQGKVFLQPEGEALILGAAGRLCSINPESGETIWEQVGRTSPWGDSFVKETGVLYGWGPYPATAWALRLSDGKLLWEHVISRDSNWTQAGGLVAGSLFVINNQGLTLLDKRTGELLLVHPTERWHWQSTVFAEGDTLVVSTADRPEFEHDPGPEAAERFGRMNRNQDRRTLYRIVTGPRSPRPTAARLAAAQTEEVLRLSMLEDACVGGSSSDPAAWRALAESSLALGKEQRAAEALHTGASLSPLTVEGLKPWRDLAETWSQVAGDEAGRFKQLAEEWSRILKCLELMAELSDPRTAAKEQPADDQFRWKASDLLRHPSPATRLATATLMVDASDFQVLQTLLQAAPEVDAALALRGFTRMLPRLLLMCYWEGNGWGNLRPEAVNDLLSDCAERSHGDLRAAALMIQELMGRRTRDPETQAGLESLQACREPLLALAAGGVLLERGDTRALATVLKAIESTDKNERTVAIWAAGRARCAASVPALLQTLKDKDDSNMRGMALEALIRIGTPEAQTAVMETVSNIEWTQAPRTVRWLRVLGTPESLGRVIELSKNMTSRYVAVAGYWELRWVDDPRARQRIIEFGLEELAGAPDEGWFLMAVLRARIAEGKLEEASQYLDRLVALWPPNAEVAGARFDLAAREGKTEEALRWRAEAERLFMQSQTVEPTRAEHSYHAGRLFLHPAAFAEPAKALVHLEKAARLDPDNEDCAKALKAARTAAAGKEK